MTVDPWLALALLCVVNLVAFAAQGIDKVLAERGLRRISEGTLAMLALPLASPGMWLGMRMFRHKTRKRSFLALAVGATIVNAAMVSALIWAFQRGWLTLEMAG
ncbi:MAG: DUF1294 domain-containing protein [Planctomycetes bacterium]|nr:DUF1294 domain-containing protein [Planctomycetota bacterium]